MALPILINKATVEARLEVAIGTTTEKFTIFCREAQEFDLKELLCDTFYFDVLKNKDMVVMTKIIQEFEFEIDGNTYYHSGLEMVLSYFAWSRYVMFSPVVPTSHGIVIKKTPHSEPADRNTRKDLYNKARNDAFSTWEGVKRYILEHLEAYPNFDCSGDCSGDTDKKGITGTKKLDF